MIDPGQLDQRITLQSPSETDDDGFGGKVLGWRDVATVWAAVEALSIRERLMAAQAQAEVSYRVTIRFRSGIQSDWRISWRGQILNIRSRPNPNRRKLYLVLDCEVGVSGDGA